MLLNIKKRTLLGKNNLKPYNYQEQALQAWLKYKRGIIALPTGSGKSYLAAMALSSVKCSAIFLLPTIDLLMQWHKNLNSFFKEKIGILGGGSFQIEHITVSTYDSARIHATRLGNRFALIVFDECHHLGGVGYSEMARAFIAPYRLGLSATPDQDEFRESVIIDILGSIIYQKEINELSGNYLANYEIKTIYVDLEEEEKKLYQYHRDIYLTFRKRYFSYGSNKWEDFIFHANRSKKGRLALKSFHTQKSISYYAKNKIKALIRILSENCNERILIFTHDNKTAYHLSNLLFIPVITHEIGIKERKQCLKKFKEGKWNFLISTRVLNEGVDIPEANIAIIISGNSTVKEQIQRLGRILRRKTDNKKAILYELVTNDTTEIYTSRRRKEHIALQKKSDKSSF